LRQIFIGSSTPAPDSFPGREDIIAKEDLSATGVYLQQFGRRPFRHQLQRGIINEHHAGFGTFHNTTNFFRGETPVDGIGDDTQLGAGEL
jgi:hypothetical protein